MLYTGIDYHKKYSVVSTMDATGARIREARIDENDVAAFAAYFKGLPETSRVVVEACWTGDGSTTSSARLTAWRTWCSLTRSRRGSSPTRKSRPTGSMPAGSYTARIEGGIGDSGIALLEIYAVP